MPSTLWVLDPNVTRDKSGSVEVQALRRRVPLLRQQLLLLLLAQVDGGVREDRARRERRTEQRLRRVGLVEDTLVVNKVRRYEGTK